MGIKVRRTKILLGLSLLPIELGSFIKLDYAFQTVFDLSLNQKTKGTISGMTKEGLIVKKSDEIINNSTPLIAESSTYKLVEKGFYELCLVFPFFRFTKENWDGKWRVLSYEIPEKKRELRDRLRREVAGWGLGPWHRSFWLTPHPIIENLKNLVSQKEEEKYVQAFESEHVFGDRENLIEKVWNKSGLDKKYRDLFKKWHNILSSQEEKILKMKKVVSEYVDVLRFDPGLPVELVSQSWIGFEAHKIFKEIKSILLL